MRKTIVMLLCGFWLIASSCGSDANLGNDPSGDQSCQKDNCGRCPDARVGLKICSFVATPTASESVTLVNYGSEAAILTNWTLWDANALGNGSGQKTFHSSDIITAGATATFGSLPFVINDAGETITLKDNAGTLVDQRSN